MAYNGDPLFDARKLTPSPNPVESLRALPEQKIVAWRWQREDDTWSLWVDEELVSHRDSPYKKIQLAYASAPDAELLEALRGIKNVLEDMDKWSAEDVCANASCAYAIAEDILAKHSTAAEEGHGSY